MAATATDRLLGEYETLTTGCGLVDRSERGKLALSGADAVDFLNGQVTNELVNLHPGEGRYAAFLTNKGKMLGDLRVLAVGGGSPTADAPTSPDAEAPVRELLLDTERVALQALFDMIRRYRVGYGVELHKRTLECALLSLVGPLTRACANGAGMKTLPESEHDHLTATLAGRPVRPIAATGGGLDVLCAAADREAVAAALVDAGAQPVGEAAAEIVRVERGEPRYGLDIDDGTIPQEAGLNERAVSFTKGCYVGQETVARLYYRGKPNRHLRGLRLSGPAAGGEELHLGERPVGRLGSVVLSPARGPLALALVRREAAPGDVLAVGTGGVTATVAELPFT